MTAARPPGLSRRRNRARNSSSVFLVLTTSQQVLGGGLVVEAASERRIGEDQRVALRSRRRHSARGSRGSGCRAARPRAAACSCWRCAAWWSRSRSRGTCCGGSARCCARSSRARRARAAVLSRRHQEACRATGRIADLVARARGHHLDHQLDDVPRGAELAVLPAVAILLSMYSYRSPLVSPSLQRDVVEHVDGFRQQVRRGDGEPRVLHVLGVRRVVPAELPQPGEHPLATTSYICSGCSSLNCDQRSGVGLRRCRSGSRSTCRCGWPCAPSRSGCRPAAG